MKKSKYYSSLLEKYANQPFVQQALQAHADKKKGADNASETEEETPSETNSTHQRSVSLSATPSQSDSPKTTKLDPSADPQASKDTVAKILAEIEKAKRAASKINSAGSDGVENIAEPGKSSPPSSMKPNTTVPAQRSSPASKPARSRPTVPPKTPPREERRPEGVEQEIPSQVEEVSSPALRTPEDKAAFMKAVLESVTQRQNSGSKHFKDLITAASRDDPSPAGFDLQAAAARGRAAAEKRLRRQGVMLSSGSDMDIELELQAGYPNVSSVDSDFEIDLDNSSASFKTLGPYYVPTGVRFTEIDDVHAKLRSASAAIMKIGADRSRHPSEPTPQVEIAIAKAHGAMSPGNFDALSNVSSPRPNYHAASFHQHYADTDWVTVAVDGLQYVDKRAGSRPGDPERSQASYWLNVEYSASGPTAPPPRNKWYMLTKSLMRGKTAVFQIPARCLRDEMAIDEPLEVPVSHFASEYGIAEEAHFVTVQIWLQKPSSDSHFAASSESDGANRTAEPTQQFNPPQSPSKIPGSNFAAATPTASTNTRNSSVFTFDETIPDHTARKTADVNRSHGASDADVVRTIDSWMCELAAWKLSDLYDVASRLHIGTGSDKTAEDAFNVAKGVLAAEHRANTGDDRDIAAEVARVRACRERLIQLIVESRHRHLRSWRQTEATQADRPDRTLVATGALDVGVFLQHSSRRSSSPQVASPGGGRSFQPDEPGRQMYYRVPLRKENSTITGSVELRISRGNVLHAAPVVKHRNAVYSSPAQRTQSDTVALKRPSPSRGRRPNLFIDTGVSPRQTPQVAPVATVAGTGSNTSNVATRSHPKDDVTMSFRRCKVHASDLYKRFSAAHAAALQHHDISRVSSWRNDTTAQTSSAEDNESSSAAYLLFEMAARRYCVPLEDKRGTHNQSYVDMRIPASRSTVLVSSVNPNRANVCRLSLWQVVSGAGADVMVGESPVFMHNVVRVCRESGGACKATVKLQHDFLKPDDAPTEAASVVELDFTVEEHKSRNKSTADDHDIAQSAPQRPSNEITSGGVSVSIGNNFGVVGKPQSHLATEPPTTRRSEPQPNSRWRSAATPRRDRSRPSTSRHRYPTASQAPNANEGSNTQYFNKLESELATIKKILLLQQGGDDGASTALAQQLLAGDGPEPSQGSDFFKTSQVPDVADTLAESTILQHENKFGPDQSEIWSQDQPGREEQQRPFRSTTNKQRRRDANHQSSQGSRRTARRRGGISQKGPSSSPATSKRNKAKRSWKEQQRAMEKLAVPFRRRDVKASAQHREELIETHTAHRPVGDGSTTTAGKARMRQRQHHPMQSMNSRHVEIVDNTPRTDSDIHDDVGQTGHPVAGTSDSMAPAQSNQNLSALQMQPHTDNVAMDRIMDTLSYLMQNQLETQVAMQRLQDSIDHGRDPHSSGARHPRPSSLINTNGSEPEPQQLTKAPSKHPGATTTVSGSNGAEFDTVRIPIAAAMRDHINQQIADREDHRQLRKQAETPYVPGPHGRRLLVTADGHLPASGTPRKDDTFNMISLPTREVGPAQRGSDGAGRNPDASVALPHFPETSIQRQLKLGMTLKDWVRRSSAQEQAGIAAMQRLMVIVQSESLPIGAARIATEKARLAEAGLLARPAAGELVWEATLGNPEAAQAVQEIVDKLRTIHGFCVQLIQLLTQAEQLRTLREQQERQQQLQGRDYPGTPAWSRGDQDRYRSSLRALEEECKEVVDTILQGQLSDDVLNGM